MPELMSNAETWEQTTQFRAVLDMGAIVAIEQAWVRRETGEYEWQEIPSVNRTPNRTVETKE